MTDETKTTDPSLKAPGRLYLIVTEYGEPYITRNHECGGAAGFSVVAYDNRRVAEAAAGEMSQWAYVVEYARI